MRQRILIAIVSLSTALLATTAFACPPGGGGGKHGHFGKRGKRGPNVERLAEKLGLDQTQRQQLEALEADREAAVTPLREKSKQLREQMKALWQADTVDQGAVLALHDQIGAVKQQMHRVRIEFRLGMMSVLTPEQRAQMQTFREQRMERRNKRGKRGKRGMRRGNRGDSDVDFRPGPALEDEGQDI